MNLVLSQGIWSALLLLMCQATSYKFCDIKDYLDTSKCYNDVPSFTKTKDRSFYILYDINQVEGFNLRRDVYIRMATFVWSIRQKPKYKNVKLVLPPFLNMYHWHSQNIDQKRVFWGEFFDLESLRKFIPVLDFPEFLAELDDTLGDRNKTYIDEVFKLQSYDEMFEDGVFRDKFEKATCKNDDERRRGTYFGYKNLTHRTFACINFQGGAKMLKKMLNKYKTPNAGYNTMDNRPRIVLVLRSETVLHDFWSTPVYWKARRSLRFSKALTLIAEKFRHDFLHSFKDKEMVQRPENWLDEKPYRGAVGGNYLAVHLRRADFLYGREVPTIQSASAQIKNKLKELGLDIVFIASDCTGKEFNDLKKSLHAYRVVKFKPESKDQFEKMKDGGVAIIDQIICAHARYFIGTYESTFTFRIYEEREILGFDQKSTYNTFCKREDMINCETNTPWTIMY
ncbi:GDP-fucose protein O-fucosyltransferase 2 [Culicoides brevitarsis]|uniref:GDP-fucose protein O-fucosyltransferase 2 n=1 Tax=Culicoides brevitarsis TaxID=469753 RepID=UPI00307C4C5F